MSIWTTILDYFDTTPRCQHTWRIVSAASMGFSTCVVMRCVTCGELSERNLEGRHELKNLQSTENEDQSYGQL